MSSLISGSDVPLTNGGEVCAIASEEEEEIILTGNNQGKYVVAIDPLDGSVQH